MVAHISNPITWEVEAGTQFKARLSCIVRGQWGYMRPCLTNVSRYLILALFFVSRKGIVPSTDCRLCLMEPCTRTLSYLGLKCSPSGLCSVQYYIKPEVVVCAYNPSIQGWGRRTKSWRSFSTNSKFKVSLGYMKYFFKHTHKKNPDSFFSETLI